MVPEKLRLSPAERANLVAYLDGELNEAESRAIATKLTQSVTARKELEDLEKTWELLEHLPRPEPSAEFTERTLTEARLIAERGDRLLSVADATARRVLSAVILVASALLTLGACYAATRWLWPDPSARLLRELSLAEHLDEYLDVGSFDFLRQLDESPEFTSELTLLPTEESAEGADANLKRLRAMPVEERQILEKNLERFDLLPASQRAAARSLDEQLAGLPAEDRTRYLSLMRRYHFWQVSLSDDERQALAQASGQNRLAQVESLRKADRAEPKIAKREPRKAELALGGMGPFSFFQTAEMLKVWLALPADQQAKVSALAREARTKALIEAGKNGGVLDPKFARRLEKYVSQRPKMRAAVDKLKKEKGDDVAARLVEARYLIEHQPEPVDREKLAQFDRALPGWVRVLMDPLPPETARRRLTILYRLIYPVGHEMPAPAKAEPPKPAPAPAPARPRPSQGPAPQPF